MSFQHVKNRNFNANISKTLDNNTQSVRDMRYKAKNMQYCRTATRKMAVCSRQGNLACSRRERDLSETSSLPISVIHVFGQSKSSSACYELRRIVLIGQWCTTGNCYEYILEHYGVVYWGFRDQCPHIVSMSHDMLMTFFVNICWPSSKFAFAAKILDQGQYTSICITWPHWDSRAD